MSEANRMAFDDLIEEEGTEQEGSQETGIQLFSAPAKLTAEDVTIPRLRLAQGLTKEVNDGAAKPGQYILTGVGPRDVVDATVLAVAKFRRLTAPEDGAVQCRSEDGEVGHGIPGGECASCPMSKWINSEDKGGKNTPPPCQFGYRYLLDVADYGQCVFEMKRTAIGAAKALNGMVMRTGYGNTRVRFQSAKASGGRGVYYTPIIIPLP